jgi:hypothetical protein
VALEAFLAGGALALDLTGAEAPGAAGVAKAAGVPAHATRAIEAQRPVFRNIVVFMCSLLGLGQNISRGHNSATCNRGCGACASSF